MESKAGAQPDRHFSRRERRRGGACHGGTRRRRHRQSAFWKRVALVGSPNVGKSMLFKRLTNMYATVSNYPGTTVEVFKGIALLGGRAVEIIDTPGMYSLVALSDEERVSRDLVTKGGFDLIINVVDAKDLPRMLMLSIELCSAGLPVILLLNMADEARKRGITVDTNELADQLGIPCLLTSMTTGEGLPELKKLMQAGLSGKISVPGCPQACDQSMREALAALEKIFAGHPPTAEHARMQALLALKGDQSLLGELKKTNPLLHEQVEAVVGGLLRLKGDPADLAVTLAIHRAAGEIAARCVSRAGNKKRFRDRLGAFLIHPVFGFPILFLVVYVGLYLFVGVLGAGVVVNFLENDVMDAAVVPAIVDFVKGVIPSEIFQDLFIGDFGLITMGLKYAIAIIFPIVLFFFIVFSILEDTGYLPRLAMLLDRTLKKIGLSGRAVIPMVLGLGCDTMATLVTRILPTRRERFIATLLLALAVPCSAQLGVMLALLASNPAALVIWFSVVGLIFVAVGFLSARVLPGARPMFYMELPPLRFPSLLNVAMKTFVRLKWYLKEIIPIFLLGSVVLWVLKYSTLLGMIESLLKGPVGLMGLPEEASIVFLLGFFRRDYGSAGLYLLADKSVLSGNQLLIACVALTLFLPCIAQFFINIKERGLKQGLAISGIVLIAAFVASVLLNQSLILLGVNL